MQAISKNIIFYITVVESNKADHAFLRGAIHRVLPQAIVESIYNDHEAIQYFNNCSKLPHLIFLDQDMLKISGRNTLELIKRVDGLDQVPIVFLSKLNTKSQRTDFIEQGESHFYSKPYEVQELLNIVGSLNNKWLA
jgi:CheY-like chemotaxis protein